jgi:YbbR domain-containing protein
VNAGQAARRTARTIVHNWPLKLAAILLATLLYAGLVASQDSSTFPGQVPVTAVNVPAGTLVTNDLRDVEEIRYLAPLDVPRLRAEDFRATVDVAHLQPDGQPASVRVNVTAVDPRVTILDVQPRTIQVVLDELVVKAVPVEVERGAAPSGVDVGETTVEPTEATITGPAGAVNRVVAARASVPLDPRGIDVDREVDLDPVDATGAIVAGVDVNPGTVHVTIPLFTDKQSRTVPVNPVVTGTPAPGFRIAAVEADPLVVSVEGDAEQLATLTQADTAPVAVFGASSDVSQVVALALPTGIVALGDGTVTVRVVVEPVTETRTLSAGIRLDGRDPGLEYRLSDTQVLLTVFGSVADLDRLASAPLVVGIDVGGLAPGTHEVAIVPELPAAVTLVEAAPEVVTVTIDVPPTPTPPPTPGPTPAPSATPSPTSAPATPGQTGSPPA